MIRGKERSSGETGGQASKVGQQQTLNLQVSQEDCLDEPIGWADGQILTRG